jgi:short-subunit dehydrogenase involved in D-alanine esterification of teichoic acids
MSATEDVIARGNVAVITGGASGIGLAMAEALERATQTNPTLQTGD